MKINYLFKVSLLAILVSCFISCSSEDDGEGNGDGDVIVYDSFRAREVITTEIEEGDVIQTKYLHSYIGNRINETVIYEKYDDVIDWELDEKIVYTYEGDWVFAREYWYLGDLEWSDAPQYFKYKIVNEEVLEIEWFNTVSNNYDFRNVYTYNYEDLVKMEYSYEGMGDGLYEYNYNGDQVNECIESHVNNGIPSNSYRSEYVYSNYRLVEIINYQWWLVDNVETWVKFSKDVYSYADDKVTEINNFYWNLDNNEWEIGSQNEYFSYSTSHGLLEREELDMLGYDSNMVKEITYEPGNGNLDLFSFPERNIRNYPIIKSTLNPHKLIEKRTSKIRTSRN